MSYVFTTGARFVIIVYEVDIHAVIFKYFERRKIMLNAKGVNENEFLEYKGRPLVRKDNDIYYGDLSEKYHVFMMIMMEKPSTQGEEIPDTIMVQLMDKDTGRPEKQTISKSLADALETADAWLLRYNK